MTYLRLQASTRPAVARQRYSFWPSEQEINDALAGFPRMIGRPRIVRQNDNGHLVTYVTILVEVGDVRVATLNAVQDGFFARLPGGENATPIGTPYRKGDYWDYQILPYNPATDGTVEWWRTGVAAQTQTRNQWDPTRVAVEPIATPPVPPPVVTPPARSTSALYANPAPHFRAFEIIENTATPLNAPTFEMLADIFNSVPKGPGVVWLGNATRVTRFVTGGTGIRSNITRAVRVAYFPDLSRLDTQVELIRAGLEDALAGARGASFDFEPVQVLNLDVRFGRPAFWTSGEASRSQTWQRFSLLTNDENPYGPDDPRMRPTTMGEWGAANLPGSSVLWPIALALLAGTLVYFGGPVVAATSAATTVVSSAKAPSRRNPSRRRSRRSRRAR